jgi:hypothetical protein
MASTNTVDWLRKEMQEALRLGLPLVGCSDWPSPIEADPPELRRSLDETDVGRPVELAHRRGIANGHIVAVWNAAKVGENSPWMTDFIDTLDNLPPGDYGSAIDRAPDAEVGDYQWQKKNPAAAGPSCSGMRGAPIARCG